MFVEHYCYISVVFNQRIKTIKDETIRATPIQKQILTFKLFNMKKKYILLRLLYTCLGYLSMGMFVFSLVLILLGDYTLSILILLILSIVSTIITTRLDHYYQTQIDKIDYDDLR